jgi:orotidine-5'-phosphate decarboxylase
LTHIPLAPPGNTVALQYSSGVYKISSWAHITNAHLVPGEGIVTGLKSVGLPLGRGLLLLAEMSSKGTLATGDYTKQTVALARRHTDFIMGFIALHRVDEDESASNDGGAADDDFVVMTPGIGLDVKGDAMGQQYITPQEAILRRGTDVAIVGRGIYGSGDPSKIVQETKRYRDACWKAYQERLSSAQ